MLRLGSKLKILYVNEKDNSLHEVLLNDIEIEHIENEITRIFAAKRSNVLVSEERLRLYKEEDDLCGKTDNR